MHRLQQAVAPVLQRRCIVCGKPLAFSPGLALCAQCLGRLTPREAGFCPACGLLHGQPDSLPHLCASCLDKPPAWEHMYFHGPYDSLLGELLRAYKFKAALGLGELLQTLAVETFFLREYALPDVIVPVPLHTRRLLHRGYNQSLELGRMLSRRLGRPLAPDGLRRVRATVPQVALERENRLHNVHGAFQASGRVVSSRRVLLLDDVMTTGSTLQECTRVLLLEGASAVDILVLARA